MEIRPLHPADDRTRFDSGESELDRFLRSYAGQNQFRHHVGTTYVAVERANILAYATVSAAHLEIDALPEAQRRKLPRYPLPILRLARLAVHKDARGLGLGKAMTGFVLNLALEMAEKVGCVGVLVDAKPGAVEFYEKLGFLAFDVDEGAAEARPKARPMFLSLTEIRKAHRQA